MPLIASLGANHSSPVPLCWHTLVDGSQAVNLMMDNPIVTGKSLVLGQKAVLQGLVLLLLLLLTA